MSRSTTDTTTLRLGESHDPLDDGRDHDQIAVGQRTGDWFDFAKAYSEGNIEVALELSAGVGKANYHLLLHSVPFGNHQGSSLARLASTRQLCIIHNNTVDCGSDLDKRFVFAGVTQLVETPEKIIPSFVRIERAKERRDFTRDVLASTFDCVIDVGRGVAEGESRELRVDLPADDCSGVSSLIERSAQVLNCLDDEVVALVRKLFDEFNLVDGPASLRVGFDNWGRVWFVRKVDLELPLKILRVFLCPCESALGRTEGIGHGQASKATGDQGAQD
jgi:hypothetical protein